jgi:membrane-bound ClpP family serine protease
MKTLLLGLSLLFPALLAAAATMDKDIAHVVITQSELENASRRDEMRRWINEASTRGAKSLILEINVTQGSAQESMPHRGRDREAESAHAGLCEHLGGGGWGFDGAGLR